jgi:transcriptional regulator with XRE-family HTH domain
MRRNHSPLLELLDREALELHSASADEPVDVGARLRALREGRRLSIKALAEASGLAVNTLSLIEHGKSSPSVSTLQQLAAALRVPITAFFTPEAPRSRVVYHRAGELGATPFPHGALTNLGVGIARRSIEPLLLALDPGASSGHDAIAHSGQEFVHGLHGHITYTVAGQIYLIGPGDSLLFEAALPHGWHNHGEAPASALLVLCPYEPPGNPPAHYDAPATEQ